MTKLLRALCLASALLASGCGAVLFRTYQEVPVECTNAPAATFAVPAEGIAVGSGGVLRLDRRRHHTVVVAAPGHVTRRVELVSTVSAARVGTSMVLNVAPGYFTLFVSTLVGCVVDLEQGAWVVLEPTELTVELEPAPSTRP